MEGHAPILVRVLALIDPRAWWSMESSSLCSKWGLADIARHILQRISDTRLLSYTTPLTRKQYSSPRPPTHMETCLFNNEMGPYDMQRTLSLVSLFRWHPMTWHALLLATLLLATSSNALWSLVSCVAWHPVTW